MKIAIIGDLHGLNVWKKIMWNKDIDKFIFLGDYVDSFVIPDNDIIKNLAEIIQFKKNNMDRVVLLFGNHDIQYIFEGNNCSGRRESYAGVIGDLFKHNLELFKIMHGEGKYLFSHAGLNQKWIDKHLNELNDNGSTYEEAINKIFLSSNNKILFEVGSSRGGRDTASGPLWSDKTDTINFKPVIDMHQIVGHTALKKIEKYEYVTYCDNLEYGDNEFNIIEI